MSKVKRGRPKKNVEEQFSIKMENSRILKAIIETLATIIDETKIQIGPREFTISAMDPSRICLLQLTIAKKDFDKYECPKKCKIVLNLDDLDKILKRSSVNDSIELNYNEQMQKIKIKMVRNGSTRARTFSLKLIESDIEEIPMERLDMIDYGTTFGMDTDLFVEAIKDAEIYSEILNIKSEEENGLLLSSSGQIGEMEYELTEDELFDSDLNGVETGQYSITFLKSILKITGITESMEISLKTDHPFKMIFNLLEGGILKYYLAPRADTDEEEFDDEDMTAYEDKDTEENEDDIEDTKEIEEIEDLEEEE